MHEVAESIEDARIAPDLRVACSYRINIDSDGKFCAEDNGWTQYHNQSVALAKKHTHVLIADIADFYNQVYQHRVESSLTSAGIAPPRPQNLEQFLCQLTAQQSQGLPVGPFASIVLAEACLIDVDQRLLSNGIKHTRYVDDYRVFGSSRKECMDALRELIDFLYTAHRLCLQSSKTKILKMSKFIEYHLENPQHSEERGKLTLLQELIDEIYEETGYMVELDDLEDTDTNEAVRHTLEEMFDKLIDERHLRIGPARYILRRARAMRTRIILDAVLNNLEFLTPVFKDVCNYLITTMPKKKKYYRPVGDALMKLARESDIGDLPFVRCWIFEIYRRKPKIMDHEDAVELADDSLETLGIRARAIVAKASGDNAWVRGMKENWKAVSPWEQRAIIYAGSILPKAERRAWLGPIKDHYDPLISSLAKWATSN